MNWFRRLRSTLSGSDRAQPYAKEPETLVIGMQMKRAMDAQEAHSAQLGVQPSPLGDHRYSTNEELLWRWTESPVDDAIAPIVADFATLSEPDRDALRGSLSLDDFYTLITFVRRCALSDLRSGKAVKIGLAFTAIAVIAYDRVDWRDLLVVMWLACHAGKRVKAPVADHIARAARLAEPETAKALLMDRNKKVILARDCGYREVVTPEGLVLFRTRLEHFAPTADLHTIAFAMALALEAEGYAVSDLETATELPLVWLKESEGPVLTRMVSQFSGCVSIRGDPRSDPDPESSGQHLLVFLAEAASVTAAREVALAAAKAGNSKCTEIGIAAGRLCAIVIQRSSMADVLPVEDRRSLERLRSVIEPLLR